MKKIKVVAVSAMVLAMGSMVFANPKSNTKKTTVDLFGDGVVDSLKTGVEDNKGFAAVGYGAVRATDNDVASHNFNVAAGAWLADTFWFGLAYDNKNDMAEKWTKKNEYAYKTNGTVTAVDTTTTETDQMGIRANGLTTDAALANNLSVNVGINGIGGEVYWKNQYQGTKDNSVTSKDTQSTATKEEAIFNKTAATKNNNTWGINFSGIKTAESGDLAFYVGLDNVEFTLNNAGSVTTLNEKKTQYGTDVGVTLGSGKNIDGTNNASKTWTEEAATLTDYTSQKIGGAVAGSLGLTLPEVGIMTPKFEFADKIEGYYNAGSKKSGSKKVTTTNTTKTTVETNGGTNYGADFNIMNTATPAMKFEFDAGEAVKIAAKVKVPVSFDYNRNGVGRTTSRTITTTENLARSTKTINNEYTENASGTQDVDTYTVEVKPELDLGLVWAVVPGKLNFNFGVVAKPGEYKWVTENKTTNKGIFENAKTVYTDEFGVETVTVNTVAMQNGGADNKGTNADTHTVTFTDASALVKANLGATFFLGEYVTLDTVLTTGTTGFGIGSFIENTTMDIMFSVKF